MSYAPVELLTVYLDADGRRKVGRLAVSNRQFLFEYDAAHAAAETRRACLFRHDLRRSVWRLQRQPAGARPKIVAQVNASRDRIIHGTQALRAGYEHWIIKFPSSQDGRDAGKVEYAYSLMAKDAGVDMPETHLFLAKKRQRYFGARRFDRAGDTRIHMHSLSGLIHADHRHPSLDYDTILRVALLLTRNVVEVEKVYALACFNVLAYNCDDHAKNFSFLLNERNEWVFAPAYDLTFSYGPGGEQSTMIMGEGKQPGVTQLRALGKKHGLKRASEILERVLQAVSHWKCHAECACVSARQTSAIAAKIGA